jgi:hypothetical protein
MKNKTKLTRTPRQTRRFPTANPTPATPATTTTDRHEFLVLSYYPGMPIKPNTPVAA